MFQTIDSPCLEWYFLIYYAVFRYNFFFNALKEVEYSENEVIDSIINNINYSELTDSSLVIFPIYSFGIEDIGLPMLKIKERIHIESKNILIFPQQNNIENVKECIRLAKKSFKMSSLKIDEELLQHYILSRPLKWLKSNQLMIIKINYSSGDYYENERFLIRTLESNVSKTFLFYTLLGEENNIINSKGFSTRCVNNWETKDIYHYIVFSKNKKKLIPSCVPIHTNLSNSLELFKINIDMPVNFEKKARKKMDKIDSYINVIYLKCVNKPNGKHDYEWDFFDKFRRSLTFFVRSYQSKYPDDSILYLYIAFEMIYCDGEKENIGNKLKINLLSILSNEGDNIKKYIAQLYNSRSGVAHEGKSRGCDIESCRKIYLHAFEKTMKLVEEKKVNVNLQKPFTEYSKKLFVDKVGFSPI